MIAELAPFAQVGRPPLTKGEGDWLERVELITPAMCGHNSLFIGQLGDWTWDAVGASCQIDPYIAVDPNGNPVYLAFAYFRVKAGSGLCVEQLTFGDRLRVRSKALSCGGDSVLTVHQVSRDHGVPGDEAARGTAPGVDDFFRYDTPGCIHVENFNRWIQRSGHDTNHGLRRATPAGFQVQHLDQVADEHTPRRIWAEARKTAGFRAEGEPAPEARRSYQLMPPAVRATFRVVAAQHMHPATAATVARALDVDVRDAEELLEDLVEFHLADVETREDAPDAAFHYQVTPLLRASVPRLDEEDERKDTQAPEISRQHVELLPARTVLATRA